MQRPAFAIGVLVGLATVLAAVGAAANSSLPLRRNDTAVTSSDGVYGVAAHDPICTAPSPPASWMVDDTLLAASADLRIAADPGGFSDTAMPVVVRQRTGAEDPTIADIFVASSSYYAGKSLESSARIYRIDGVSGAVSEFVSLDGANLGTPGIGGLAYNPSVGDGVFYASAMKDGKVYAFSVDDSLASTGTLEGVLDPFAPASSHAAEPIAPLGERISAIGYNVAEGRVYVGLWLEDANNAQESTSNHVYSFPTDAQGVPIHDLTASDGLHFDELLVPEPDGHSTPVASIAFDDDGDRMLVGTRSMWVSPPATFTVSAGPAYVFEYVGGHDFWSDPTLPSPPPPSGSSFGVGPSGADASGGAAYDAASADACNAGPHVIASASDLGGAGTEPGLQLLPSSGGSLATSDAAVTSAAPTGVAVCTGCAPHAPSVPSSSPALRGVLLAILALVGLRGLRGRR